MSFCKNRTLKQTLLASAVLLAMNTQVSHAATTLTFQDNASPLAEYPATIPNPGSGVPFITAFVAGTGPGGTNPEFRMISPFASIGGGGVKDVIYDSAGQTWTFDDSDATSLMTSVSGMPSNSGTSSTTNSPVAPTAGTNDALQQIAPFFGGDFTFLAPVSGSLAGNAYGEGKATVLVLDRTTPGSEVILLSIDFPVLEAQWGGTYFPLGQTDNKGITFSSNVSNFVNIGGGMMTFDFVLYGEHNITADEDPGGAGFAFWTAQWELPGTGQAKIIDIQAPFVTGGDTPPTTTTAGTILSNGRIVSKSELLGTVGATTDTGVTEMCVGSCWDFTVTTVVGASAVITLPLSAPIPADPAPGYPVTYRKYMNGAWSDFDTSGDNNIESAAGSAGDDCTGGGLVWTSGLTAGHFCMRLTIVDDGPNDSNKTTGTIVDPGGIGIPEVPPAPPRVGSPLDAAKGCSMSTVPVDPSQRADWWLVAGFLGALAWLRRKRHEA